MVCNHPARFGDHRYCGSGDKMFLIYRVPSSDHVFKGLCDLVDWSFVQQVTTLPSLLAIGLVIAVVQTKTFLATLQDYVIK